MKLIRNHWILSSLGVPSQYHEDMPQVIVEYARGGFKDCDDPFPTLAGCAAQMGLTRHALALWSREYPEMKEAVEVLRNAQEMHLTNGATIGKYNGGFSKFLLSVHHGLHEKTSTTVDHTSSDGTMKPAVFKGVGPESNEDE